MTSPTTHRRRRGFTLIEVLIVVVILGILAATVLPQFADTSSGARVSAARQNLQVLRAQVELYDIQVGDYPATLEDLTSEVDPHGPWLRNVPVNPLNDSNAEAPVDAKPSEDGDGEGWQYNAATGEVYAMGGHLDETNETQHSWEW